MKLRLLLLSIVCSCVWNAVMAENPAYTTTPTGVIIYTDSLVTGSPRAVKLEVIADNIIRVIAAPGREMAATQSLVTTYTKKPGLTWNVVPSKTSLTLKTKSLSAIVDLKTGAVSFFDAKGKRILAEKQPQSRSFDPVVFDGKRYYNISQTFQSTSDDAWYGLGQHQDGVLNYKDQQVTFFQNNTEVAIPFLISSKNYGVLWDNYSLTRAGDVRPLHQISALQLYSKNGEEGWLTASYCNNKNATRDIVLERAESEINMEFLNDSRIVLPAAFTPATGSVIWEGSIASNFTGLHKLRFVFGGTIKVWVNGKPLLDRWRKAWNPAPALLPLQLKQGEKVPIRIEWIPEGAESYLSIKWQEPLTKAEQNAFSFSSEAAKQVDYYFIHGDNMDKVIAGYRNLTGKAPIVPKWALGFWQSRERYKTQAEILTTIDEFRKRKIPIDNI
ncbi:MAG TPA: PA14 domain-containing protein, partial [Niastella sp.]|nr:PA14 domain-containing protein [Niastella sp.]